MDCADRLREHNSPVARDGGTQPPKATYIRSYGREQDVDLPTHDIVTPDLVERAERLGGQLADAVVDVGILLVGADAVLLDARAEGLGDLRLLHGGVVVVQAGGDLVPQLEGGDPGLVVDHGACCVEPPEGDLVREVMVSKLYAEANCVSELPRLTDLLASGL